MSTGRIKWFNDYQNYGYIIQHDGTEVYFHRTALDHASPMDCLTPGMHVVFDIIQTHTGPEAQNIELLGEGAA